MELPAVTADDDDLMTTREVAALFKTTSHRVTQWSHRTDPPLQRMTPDGKPRYRRSEVMALHASGFRGEPSAEWRKRLAATVQKSTGMWNPTLMSYAHFLTCKLLSYPEGYR